MSISTFSRLSCPISERPADVLSDAEESKCLRAWAKVLAAQARGQNHDSWMVVYRFCVSILGDIVHIARSHSGSLHVHIDSPSCKSICG